MAGAGEAIGGVNEQRVRDKAFVCNVCRGRGSGQGGGGSRLSGRGRGAGQRNYMDRRGRQRGGRRGR